MGGHLFIINGDLTKVACDAILIPTDGGFSINKHWRPYLKKEGHWPEIDRLKNDPRAGWDGSDVIALPPSDKRPRIWLGKIGLPGNTSVFDVYAKKIDAFVRAAVSAYRKRPGKERIYPWSRIRLALPIVGTDHGGGAGRKGDLILGLVEQLQTLVRDPRVDADIVLVAFGDKPYAAAQRARRILLKSGSERTLRSHWRFENQPPRVNLVQSAKSLATDALDRHLVLFIGAGVSAGAGLPSWRELLQTIADEVNFPPQDRFDDLDYRDQATILKRQFELKNRSFGKAVAKLLTKPHYSLADGLLASLPSSEAVTTNYDTLFEDAWSTAQRDVATLPDEPASPDGRWLLKLHGCVTKPERIILTRSDYLDMPRQHGALMGLVQGLLMMRHMMFVGYSLRDEDFQELIYEVRHALGNRSESQPIGTVLTLETDPLINELWAQDLTVIPVTIRGSKMSDEDRSRQLEIFLDLVAYLAATSASFFLDKTYDDVSDDEAPLRNELGRLFWKLQEAKDAGKVEDDSIASKVLRFLSDELGAGIKNTAKIQSWGA